MYNQAPIAQLVEQMTLNHWVLGSSPRGRTNLKLQDTVLRQCLFLCLQTVFEDMLLKNFILSVVICQSP